MSRHLMQYSQEPTIVTTVSGPAPPHIPPAHCTSQDTASLQSASSISISEEMVPNNENTKETIPIFCVMTQSLGPFGGAAANVGMLNGVASAIFAAPVVLSSGQLGSTSMTRVDSFVRTDQISQIFGPASSTVMPSGIGMHQNVPSGMGTGMPLKIGTMMPTPVMTQQAQPEILPVGRNNSAEGNISLSQQQTLATSSSSQSGFLNIWEGNLSLVRWGEPEHISRLQGWCKRSSAFESNKLKIDEEAKDNC